MHIFLLSIVLSVDGFFVGLSLGAKNIRLPMRCTLLMITISMLFAFFSISFGEVLAQLLPGRTASVLGGAIMLLIGLWLVIGGLVRRPPRLKEPQGSFFSRLRANTNLPVKILSDPPAGDMNHSGVIEWKEALILGMSLSIDILGTGVAMGALGVSAFFAVPCIGLSLFFFLSAGTLMASRVFRLFSLSDNTLSCICGAILVLVSISRLI